MDSELSHIIISKTMAYQNMSMYIVSLANFYRDKLSCYVVCVIIVIAVSIIHLLSNLLKRSSVLFY